MADLHDAGNQFKTIGMPEFQTANRIRNLPHHTMLAGQNTTAAGMTHLGKHHHLPAKPGQGLETARTDASAAAIATDARKLRNQDIDDLGPP